MLLRNVKYHSNILDEQRIRDEFEKFDLKYNHIPHNPEEFNFIVEQPPKKLEISKALVEMCK